jgi:hypothetical protein
VRTDATDPVAIIAAQNEIRLPELLPIRHARMADSPWPLILRDTTYAGVPRLDATGVHVEAAIDWLLGGVRRRPQW